MANFINYFQPLKEQLRHLPKKSEEYYALKSNINLLKTEEKSIRKHCDKNINESRKKIAMVFQQFNLLPKRSVLDNVMLPLMYRGLPMADRIERAREMLKRVGLENFESYLPTQLSGGMKQRVAIARALAGNPKLILADEPTGALDSKMGNEILKFFKELNESLGITIVMITHEFDIAKYADRLIHIRDGKINYDGPIPKNDSKL